MVDALLDALLDAVGDELVHQAGGVLGGVTRGRVPVTLAFRLKRAHRRAATGRSAFLPVRVRYVERGRQGRRWSRGVVRIEGPIPQLGLGHRWARRWAPLPGTAGHGNAEVVAGQRDPRGWPVLLLTAPDRPDVLLAAHPLVLRLLARLSGVPVSGLDLGPADRSAPPRHRTSRSTP